MKNKLHGSIVFRLFLSILILVQADTDSSPLLHVTLTSHSDSSTRVGVAEWKSEWNHLENATTLKVAFFSPDQDNDLEYRRTSVTTSEAHSTLWRGMLLPDRNETGFSTIYKDVDGSIGGFFTSRTLSMELVQHSNGDLVVHSTDWKDVAREEGDNHLEEKDFSRTRRVSEHKLVAEFATSFEQDQCGGQQVTKRDLEIVQSPPRRLDEEKSDPVVVDVLLLVTNRAMCSHAEERYGCEPTQRNRGPIERSLRIAHDQTNEAMRNVGALVQTRIVQIVYLDPSYDGRPNPETANFLYLDQRVESWRVATGGDLTMLIAGTDPDWNGYATFFRGTAVVAHDRLRSYTYAHEMGHLFEMRHNREECPDDLPYAHAYRQENKFRTLLGDNCKHDSCPIIPVYSANGYQFNGYDIGDESHDNARKLREVAVERASRYETVQPQPNLIAIGDLGPTFTPSNVPSRAPSPSPVLTPTDVMTFLGLLSSAAPSADNSTIAPANRSTNSDSSAQGFLVNWLSVAVFTLLWVTK